MVISETNDEEIYDIRKLMGITFRKASSFNNRDEKKTDTDKAEAKNVSEETKTQENKQ